LMGNLGFLMKFYTPVFGSDGPLWSLAYEGWFYITFPLFFVVLRKNSLLAGLIMVGLFVVANFIGTGFVLFDKVFGLMLCWWLGIVLADIYVGRIKIKWIYLAPLVFLIPILILDLFPLIGHNLSSLYWSLGFFGMFSTLFWMQSNNISLQILEKLKITGDFSYTLYVIHMPILVLFSGILMVQNEEKSLPSNFIFVFLGILFTMVVSKFVYHWVEKPFLTKR
ncbi:MAG: acyltransferase family protein, partial [Cyclobacteriaceae bacterium]|nr:acyltransferase family protein [Cyclobacteriaceae bacterium]